MRQISVNTFITLDGVMQAPGGPEEDRTGGFMYGGWSYNYWDDMMGREMGESMAKPFDILLGRKTYEIFAAHWPYVTADNPDYDAAKALNSARKYVASKTLTSASWNNTLLLRGDLVGEITRIKMQDGPEIQVHGSENLIQTLLKNDLIDKFRVWIFPLTIGSGKRLFAEGTIPAGLTLLESKTSSTGVIIASYAKAGAVRVGSFALQNPSESELERRKMLNEG